MEIRIGMQNNPREVVVDTKLNVAEVTAKVDAALKSGETLSLSDEKGRVVLVPGSVIAYVEIAGGETRRVGFNN